MRIDKVQIFQGTGPDSGEVIDIAIDPRGGTDQVVYIATNDGGIWKTTDGGTTWAAKTDAGCLPGPGPCPSLSMGAVTLDPRNPDIVYAGTGNPFDGGCHFSKGVGVYKSTNGGDTWRILNPGGIFTTYPPNSACPPFPTSGISWLLHPPNPPGFNIDLLLRCGFPSFSTP